MRRDTNTVFLGIDPGVSGGIAAIYPDRSVVTKQIPDTPARVYEAIRDFAPSGLLQPGQLTTICYLEAVNGYQGKPHPGSRMFAFGQSYGWLEMSLIGHKITYLRVSPKFWQRALAIPPRVSDETDTQWKNRLKVLANKLYPGRAFTLRTADALLIAECCRLGLQPKNH